MRTLEQLYDAEALRPDSDIIEHLPKLRALASACKLVVEFGVFRGASSVALLLGCPGYVYSYDVRKQPEVDEIARASNGRWVFRLADSATAAIPACDMLWIDSWHTGEHLRAELDNHAHMVNRWIAMHDTETFGHRGEDGSPGLWGALQDWLAEHPEWRLAEHYTNNNGFTLLERA
jgi:hypothetical protein